VLDQSFEDDKSENSPRKSARRTPRVTPDQMKDPSIMEKIHNKSTIKPERKYTENFLDQPIIIDNGSKEMLKELYAQDALESYRSNSKGSDYVDGYYA
jgi:hypothetical protein